MNADGGPEAIVIDPTMSSFWWAKDINSSGDVVGSFQDDVDGTYKAFLYNPGLYAAAYGPIELGLGSVVPDYLYINDRYDGNGLEIAGKGAAGGQYFRKPGTEAGCGAGHQGDLAREIRAEVRRCVFGHVLFLIDVFQRPLIPIGPC